MKTFLTSILFLFAGAVSAHAQNIDSLYGVFSASRGSMRINAANEIMKYVYENEYFDNLISFKTSDEEAFVYASVYDAMGGYYMLEKNHFEKSIAFFKSALGYYEKIGNADFVNAVHGNIGYSYARIGDYENAVAYKMKCYEWETSMGDLEGLSSTLNDLGVIYSQWQQPEMAIRFFQEAQRVERPLNRPLNYANRLAALAKEYMNVDVNQSLPLIKEALVYDRNVEWGLKEERIAIHTASMGDIYAALDSLENAKNCYLQSLGFFEKNGRSHYVANTLLSLGMLQLKTKQYTDAIATLKQCAEMAEKNRYLPILHSAFLGLSEAYSKFEPNALSYKYLKQYTLIRDSLFRETSQKQIHDFQVKYETTEKQLEIERQQTEIARQKTRQLIYIGALVAAGLLLSLLVYIVHLRNRRNRELAQMNAVKDKFFSIISHDLKNPTTTQRDALQLLSENTDKWDATTLSNYTRQLLKSAKGLTDLLQNLLNWAQIQTGREVYHPSPFNLVAALQSDLNVVKSMAERKNITFQVVMPPSAIVIGDENMLITVVRNLLTNAVKFTKAGGEVTLHVFANTVSVSDTGVGMTPQQVQNLFCIDRQHSMRGTADETGTGLGLIVCHDMLQKHGSLLHVESQEGKGSRFWFELKV